jgi:hypothetical protein
VSTALALAALALAALGAALVVLALAAPALARELAAPALARQLAGLGNRRTAPSWFVCPAGNWAGIEGR